MLREVRKALKSAHRFVTPEGARVVRANILGETVFFTVGNTEDLIQRKHMNGRFYEARDLDVIRRHCPLGGVFCDVGANIGNHSIYAAKFLKARKVIPIEPNPTAYNLFISNVILNGLQDQIDMGFLGFGLSDSDKGGFEVVEKAGNLGASRLVEKSGGIQVRRGDTVFGDLDIDFLKIDVEGMEMGVLRGMEETIKRCQPAIFVEVEHENRDAFMTWTTGLGYELEYEGPKYRRNQNVLLVCKN